MIKFILLFSILASFVTLNAQDFSEKNDDGVLLYYNIISDSELYAVEVTRLGDWYYYNYEYQFDSIVIPERVRYEGRNYDVTQIGFKAFAYCDDLAYIKMGNSIKNIEEGAFHSCKKLTKVVYPDSLISIGSGAFLATSIKEAILPATLQYLGESAFSACDSNAYVYIGAFVSIIGESPFSENQALSHIDVDPKNQWYCSVDGVLYNKSQSVLLQIPA